METEETGNRTIGSIQKRDSWRIRERIRWSHVFVVGNPSLAIREGHQTTGIRRVRFSSVQRSRRRVSTVSGSATEVS